MQSEAIDPYAPRKVEVLGRYRAEDEQGRLLGEVQHMEIADPASGGIRRYHVRNSSRQVLGYIDANGMVYKRVPFRTDEEALGIYPMNEGLALLFETEAPVRLRDVSVTDAQARRKQP